MTSLFDFAVTTIFAREFLEGSIIIGEYRTIILLGGNSLAPGVEQKDALRAINVSSIVAVVFALIVIAAIAIPLAVLSNNFDNTTSNIIEGVSKIVAAISLMQLSLKLPRWLGIYASKKKDKDTPSQGLTLRSIRFNVAWNIWREVAECGVFLIPFFLGGDIKAIPLSAVVGSAVGLLVGVGVYVGNRRLKNKLGLAIFAALILMFLSAGLFTNGCHKLEMELGPTKEVWSLEGDFWSVDRLPMTILKPFGWNDSRTVLEIVCFWGSLLVGTLLHYRKYRRGRTATESQDLSHTPDGSDDSGDDMSPEENTGVKDLEGGYGRRPTSSISSDSLRDDVKETEITADLHADE